ncbi:hypothetical protein [Polycladomyces subterraneus]|nr:hypothetical protein [Polycladomyces subterraneus]
MDRFKWKRVLSLVCILALAFPVAAVASPAHNEMTRSTTEKLALKRYVAAGDRSYVIGSEDGNFPPMGWHIRGEMGGVWTHPIKLLDGYWFGVDGQWLQSAERYTTEPGSVRMDYPVARGVKVTRTEFAPDGLPVVMVGLTVRNVSREDAAVPITMDVRSELMGAYPWGWSEPNSAKEANGKDIARYDADNGRLIFQETGKPWFALVQGMSQPVQGLVGDDIWGSVPAQKRQEYLENGNGTGGRLTWTLRVPVGKEVTFWVAVAGSHHSQKEAAQALQQALAHPQALLQKKREDRKRLQRQTQVRLPDAKLQQAFEWGKWNMADLRRTVTDMRIRDVKEGKADPDQPLGVLSQVTGIGAGFPDYPWYFGTDGAYTAYALVVSGQWDTAIQHLRTIRDVSRIVNGSTGKVVHEITTDGSVYYGTNESKGNTNETAQFATAVDLVWRWTGNDAFRDEMYDFVKDGMHTVMSELDQDGDGWPEGLGMVERSGMGAEKLDVAVYTHQALQALQRMAESKGDRATANWVRQQAERLQASFEQAWWMPGEGLYADSLCNRGDETAAEGVNRCKQPGQQLQQRHWINATPMETGIASVPNALTALARLESSEFTGPTGLYHTGVGGGPDGKGELKVWSLPNSVMAVAEANYGRLGEGKALKYMDLIASELDVEMPGALTEIAPSPEYDPFVDFRERAMFMQAWSSYGVQWSVIHHFAGVRPDMPLHRLEVVPDVPDSWPGLSVSRLRVGNGYINVEANKSDKMYTTRVSAPAGWELTIGHTLPAGARVRQVWLDGKHVSNYEVANTPRGTEVHVHTRTGKPHLLTVIVE